MKSYLVCVAFAVVLTSCGAKKEHEVISKKIEETYAAQDVAVEEGNEDGKPVIKVDIGNSRYINSDSSYEIDNAGSMSAVIVYENLGENQNNKDMLIKVGVKHKVRDQTKEYTFSYPVPLVKECISHCNYVDSLFVLLINKKYEPAYDMFDSSFKATTSFEGFKAAMDTVSIQLGDISDYGLKGFELMEIEIEGKPKKFVKVNTTAIRKEPHRMEYFFELSGSPRIFGMNI